MATISEAWRCNECNSLHDDEDDARECCQPSISEGYKCDACGDFHRREATAMACCADVQMCECPACGEKHADGDAASACCGIEYICTPTPAQLEAAGQQRIQF